MLGIKGRIGWLTAGWLLACLGGCGSSVKVGKQIFNVQIFGTAISADGATGDKDPIWQKYTLTGVSFLGSDGTDATVLYDGSDAIQSQVVDRPQIIFSKDIAPLNAKTFGGITTTFATDITGAFGKKEDYTFTLPSATLQLTQTFKVETGKGLDLIIMINWKNTVSSDTMSVPTYTLSIRS